MANANQIERAEFLATCDADERAEAEQMFRLIDEAALTTIRPASYPELESEIYLALDLDRDTLIPAPADAEELIAESVR